jgi:hypothetical protein
MKLRLREGFVLYPNMDGALAHNMGGAHALHAKPRARGGDVVELSTEEIDCLFLRDQLGAFDPIDLEGLELLRGTRRLDAPGAQLTHVSHADSNARGGIVTDLRQPL